MEKRVNARIEEFITKFKDEIRNKIIELAFDDKRKSAELAEFVYDYNRLSLQKDDFVKRKRIKNAIPDQNRCSAKRANGEQCTRRCKDASEFCGTHFKGTPHGTVQRDDSLETNTAIIQKVDVFAEEIMGIVYYVDKMNNVYKTEDIIEGKQNPRIVAKCVKEGNKYKIPVFGLA
jgi:hypothetical protein